MKFTQDIPVLNIITDKDWKELVRLSGFPDDRTVRLRMEEALSCFREDQINESAMPPKKVRQKLRAIKKSALSFQKLLDQLAQSTELHHAFASSFTEADHPHPTEVLAAKRVEAFLNQLGDAGPAEKKKRVRKFLETPRSLQGSEERRIFDIIAKAFKSAEIKEHKRAKRADAQLKALQELLRIFLDQLSSGEIEDSIQEGKRGPKSGSLDLFLRKLNFLLVKHTGTPLRSGKTGPAEFAFKACQLADPDLNESSIRNTIKKVVSEIK